MGEMIARERGQTAPVPPGEDALHGRCVVRLRRAGLVLAVCAVGVAIVLAGYAVPLILRSPIRVAELGHISYRHSSGGMPPVDHEEVTVEFVGAPGRSDRTAVVTAKSFQGVPLSEDVVRSCSFAIDADELDNIVAPINRAIRFHTSDPMVSGPEAAGWELSVRVQSRSDHSGHWPGTPDVAYIPERDGTATWHIKGAGYNVDLLGASRDLAAKFATIAQRCAYVASDKAPPGAAHHRAIEPPRPGG